MTTAIGLGIVIFLGGILLAARVAFAPALDAVVVGGLILAALGWYKGERNLPRFTRNKALACVLPVAAAWYLVWYLTPLAGFNHHDDFERYFAYPVRMLATGTFTPNPLGYLGADTLGATAFLQAFIAAHFPIEYIGSVDLAGGLLLCLLLVGSGVTTNRSLVSAVVAQGLFLVINPELANISSVFLGAALMTAVILLADRPLASERSLAATVLTGFLYAGLIALKTTFAVFVLVHFVAVTVAPYSPLRPRLRAAVATALWTTIGLSPWLALHAALYMDAAKLRPPVPNILQVKEALDLFSAVALPYGESQLLWTCLALLGLLASTLCVAAAKRNASCRTGAAASGAAAGLTAGLSYFIIVAGLGPLMYGREAATRYAIPILLGTIPATLRMFDLVNRPRCFAVPSVSGGLLMIFLFAPSFVHRVKEMTDYKVPWGYFFNASAAGKKDFLEYSDNVLHGSVRGELARFQALVPPHETMGVWVAAPFWLDFRRNQIWHTDPYGISMPWARWPETINYFLLQHDGSAVRSGEVYEKMKTAPGAADRIVAFRTEAFLEELVDHAKRENIIYLDDLYALMRLRPR